MHKEFMLTEEGIKNKIKSFIYSTAYTGIMISLFIILFVQMMISIFFSNLQFNNRISISIGFVALWIIMWIALSVKDCKRLKVDLANTKYVLEDYTICIDNGSENIIILSRDIVSINFVNNNKVVIKAFSDSKDKEYEIPSNIVEFNDFVSILKENFNVENICIGTKLKVLENICFIFIGIMFVSYIYANNLIRIYIGNGAMICAIIVWTMEIVQRILSPLIENKKKYFYAVLYILVLIFSIVVLSALEYFMFIGNDII